jgi:hypothetical protein
MFWKARWLQALLNRWRTSPSGELKGWVEPSNSITRAVLSGRVSDLPSFEPATSTAEVITLPAQEAEQVPPAARRSRRGRRSTAA